MQTIYTHGTALQAENPENLVAFTKYGWGAQATFIKPKRGTDPRIPEAEEEQGPDSWFHLPLVSIPSRVGVAYPYVTSVLLVFETIRCKISDLHIYDGPQLIDQMNYQSFPGELRSTIASGPYKRDLATPHRMRYAIGISFRAFSSYNDFPLPDPDGTNLDRAESGYLIVSVGGAEYDDEISLPSGVRVRDDITRAILGG